MKISELLPGQGSVELTASVEEVGEVRSFNKFGKEGKVATALLVDDSGKIEMPLWNEQIAAVGKGDTIKITNGYVKEYQGQLQLTTGIKGTIEVLKKAPQETKSFEKPGLDEERIEE